MKSLKCNKYIIAAAISYYPNRPDVANFLTIYSINGGLSQTRSKGFLQIILEMLSFWEMRKRTITELLPHFTLTTQTASALISTLCSQAMLIDELLSDMYSYVMTARLQSDPKTFFSIHADEWKQISCQFKRSLKFRKNFILSVTD